MSRKPFANPFADPNHPLDYRDGKPVYARDVPDFVKSTESALDPADLVPSRRKPHVIVPTGSVLYNNLEWEHPAYREAGQAEKKLLSYDKSLERLRAAGYERHARPSEVFGLLIDGLEGKLTGQHKAIYDDMLTSYGEWMSAAVLVKQQKSGGIWGVGGSTKQTLTMYLDPEGLAWDGKKYVQQNFTYAEKKEFDITGKPLNAFVELTQVDVALVQDFYGCSYAQLPQQMREGDKRGGFWFPSADQIWPVGRGDFYFNRLNTFIYYHISRASRGVHAVAPKSP